MRTTLSTGGEQAFIQLVPESLVEAAQLFAVARSDFLPDEAKKEIVRLEVRPDWEYDPIRMLIFVGPRESLRMTVEQRDELDKIP